MATKRAGTKRRASKIVGYGLRRGLGHDMCHPACYSRVEDRNVDAEYSAWPRGRACLVCGGKSGRAKASSGRPRRSRPTRPNPSTRANCNLHGLEIRWKAGKPAESTRLLLRSHGYKWSPKYRLWWAREGDDRSREFLRNYKHLLPRWWDRPTPPPNKPACRVPGRAKKDWN